MISQRKGLFVMWSLSFRGSGAYEQCAVKCFCTQ